MHTLLLCLATAAVGGDVGWQRMPDGSVEYIIQIEPQALDSLRDGRAIQSDLHPNAAKAGEVRSYRIVVGNKTLPRDPPAPPATPKPPDKVADLRLPDPKEIEGGAPQSLPAETGAAARLARPTQYVEPGGTPSADKAAGKVAETQPEQPEKPWMALWGALLGLFASIGVNIFLGWIAWDCRRELLRTRTSAQTTAQRSIATAQPRADPERSPERSPR
jgi:hypothetical protein